MARYIDVATTHFSDPFQQKRSRGVADAARSVFDQFRRACNLPAAWERP